MKYILTILLLSMVCNANANEIMLFAYKESLKAHCNTNRKTYEQCFNLSNNECISLVDIVIFECSENKDGFPVINEENMHQVSTCIQNKFEKQLVNKGVDLDEPCNINNP